MTDQAAAKGSDLLVDVEKLQQDVATYEYTTYNNRRYASANLGAYYMPNDAPEIHRLNEQHFLLTTLKDGRLHNAPLPATEGLRILDVGCGSGIWCVGMADRYPDAMITGMDVSPIQPQHKPANVGWIVHDMEKDWPFAAAYFDFIHLSLVHGCVADWDEMMTKIVHHLAPGGFVEHQEFSLCRQYTLDPSTNLPNRPAEEDVDVNTLSPFLRWGRLLERAALTRGRTIQLGPHLASLQRNADGLTNVTETVYRLPCGTWPSDAKERMLGARNMLQVLQGMEGFTTVMFTRALGWGLEETRGFVEEVKRDLRDDGLRKVMDVHVVYGRKEGVTTGGRVEGKGVGKDWLGSGSVPFASGVLVVCVVAGVGFGCFRVLRNRARL